MIYVKRYLFVPYEYSRCYRISGKTSNIYQLSKVQDVILRHLTPGKMQLICTLMCLSVFCLQEWHDNGLQRNEISSLSVGWTHLLLKTNKLWVSYSDYFRDILSNKHLVINRWTPNSFLSPFLSSFFMISLSFSINIASDRAGLCVIRFVTKLVILNQFLFVTLQYRSLSFVFSWVWR